MKKLFLAACAAVFASACLIQLPEVSTLKNVEIPTVNQEEELWIADDYAGKPVFVVFMGSWCPWCKRTMPALNAIKEKYGDRVEIVGAFMDSTPGPVRDVLEEYDLQVKALFNAGDVGESMGVSGIPHAILFDKKHRAVKTWEGFAPNLEEEFEEEIKHLL